MFSWFSKSEVPKTPKRKFGYKIGHPKLSDVYHVFSADPTTLPASVDLRDKMPPVYDQGELGSCVSNATAAAVQYDLMNNKLSVSPSSTTVDAAMKSRLFIYYNARVIDNSVESDAGTTIHSAAQVLETLGVCDENLWPYVESQFATKPPSAAYKAALQFKADTYQTIFVRQNLYQLKAALAAGFVVVCGIAVYESFMNTGTDGNVRMPQPTEQLLGGHSMLVCGYDDSRAIFIVRNSWNFSWADKGYCYIPYTYICNPVLAQEFATFKKIVVTEPTDSVKKVEEVKKQ
jgi:C1A family cysteine protease